MKVQHCHDNHTDEKQIGQYLNIGFHDRDIVGVVNRNKVCCSYHRLLQRVVHRLKQAIQRAQLFLRIGDGRQRRVDLVDLKFKLFDCFGDFRHRKQHFEPVAITQQVDTADQNFIFQQDPVDHILRQTNPADCSLDVTLHDKKLTLHLKHRPDEIFAVLEPLIVKLADNLSRQKSVKHDKQDQCDKHGPA